MSIEATPDGVRLKLHVQPGASRTEVVGPHGDAIKVRLKAPPVEGRANEALCKYLAERLQVSRANVVLLRGEGARAKSVLVRGVDRPTALQRLLPEETS